MSSKRSIYRGGGPARAATPATMPVVVTAVQVYDTGGGADLVAYRWRITPTLTKQKRRRCGGAFTAG